jgi:hypothetical protein
MRLHRVYRKPCRSLYRKLSARLERSGHLRFTINPAGESVCGAETDQSVAASGMTLAAAQVQHGAGNDRGETG